MTQAVASFPARARGAAAFAALRRHAEAIAMAAILLFAAGARFVNLATRPGWDMDQGQDAIAAWTAVTQRAIPVFGPLSSVRTFHHGALYYDILAPAAWLGNGDPTVMAIELGLLGLAIVPIVWWVARSISGPVAGLIAALLAAASTALVRDTLGVWNPDPVAPGAALALLGTFQALRSGRGAWWVVAFLGVDISAQAHLAAAVGVAPVAVAYLVALARSRDRRRLLGWGIAAAAVVAVTLLPLILWELDHDFAESRAIIAFILHGTSAAWPPDPTPPADRPIYIRLLLATTRILGWPLTGWPLVSVTAAFLPALLVAMVLVTGLASRVLAVRGGRSAEAPARAEPRAADAAAACSRSDHRVGVLLVSGWLLLLVVLLGFGLKEVSDIQKLPTEQYHTVADPIVIVAAAIVFAAVAGARLAWRGRRLGPLVAVATLVAVVAWNVAWWPPLEAYDGGYPSAAAAARRIEDAAAGRTIGIVSLPAAKVPDAYRYPLMLDGARLVDPAAAEVVVVLCDSVWVSNCRGPAEEAWRAANGGDLWQLSTSFSAAPDRTMTIYWRTR